MCDNINELNNRAFICTGSTCFNLFNMPIFLEHLFETFSVCFFKFRFVFKVKVFFNIYIIYFKHKSLYTFIGHMKNHVF